MSLDLADDWVWDFWLAHEDDRAHLFFLTAPRSLGDPDLRHRNARVGHAVSTDLVTWERLPDALGPVGGPDFDDLAIWTGCVVRDDDGTWRMFHSALSRAEDGVVQRIGLATSPDLLTWTHAHRPPYPLKADPRWYALAGDGHPDQHWRDPWVVRDAAGTWHMYVTARAAGGRPGCGVVGHLTSPDLDAWTVGPPLSAPDRFDQLEVIQLVEVEGTWVLVFSCLSGEMAGAAPGAGGTWAVEVAGPGAPVDLAAAYRLTGEEWYVAKLVPLPAGDWGLMAFRHQDADGAFVGGLCDPVPVVRGPDERLRLEGFSTGLPD